MRKRWSAGPLALVMIGLGACQSGATTIENGNEAAAPRQPAEGRDRRDTIQIAFVDFFDSRARLSIDGRALFDGMLNVDRDEEATGLSRLVRVHIDQGRHVLRLVTDGLDVSVPIVVTAQTRTIYVDRHVAPHIRAHDGETLLLG